MTNNIDIKVNLNISYVFEVESVSNFKFFLLAKNVQPLLVCMWSMYKYIQGFI